MSERLTERSGERWIARQARLNGKIIGDRDIYAKLAYFEDLQEQGRLVELPCKVGDTVYNIVELVNGEVLIVKGKVFDYNISNVGEEFYFSEETKRHDIWCDLDDIGKTVFLTKAEAQAALEGMEE